MITFDDVIEFLIEDIFVKLTEHIKTEKIEIGEYEEKLKLISEEKLQELLFDNFHQNLELKINDFIDEQSTDFDWEYSDDDD